MKLTIGMPSYNNFTEVFFTVQSLRMHHSLTDCEILVVDNYGDPELEGFIRSYGDGLVRYEKYTDKVGTSCAKNRIFELARGEMVLCIDSHVLLKPGALDDIPVTDDLVHGPMVMANMKNYYCSWDNVWRGQMWGIWSPPVKELPKEPFEIWGMGTGLFLTRKASWLGYNRRFRGFGGEQGYLHEKYRKAGRKVWCYPKLIWMHMFDRKIPYPLNLADRVRNYIIGHQELGLDIKPIRDLFGEKVVSSVLEALARETSEEIVQSKTLEDVRKLWKEHSLLLSPEEIFEVVKVLNKPCNMLVFGAGNDSGFWHDLNQSGKTVILESDPKWVEIVIKKYPSIDVRLVTYGTKRVEWQKLLKDPVKLAMDLPDDIRNTAWDIILVDAPRGDSDDAPGRMKSIYEASRLIRRYGHVFVHDVNRVVELEYCKEYLGGMIGRTKNLAHYIIDKYS